MAIGVVGAHWRHDYSNPRSARRNAQSTTCVARSTGLARRRGDSHRVARCRGVASLGNAPNGGVLGSCDCALRRSAEELRRLGWGIRPGRRIRPGRWIVLAGDCDHAHRGTRWRKLSPHVARQCPQHDSHREDGRPAAARCRAGGVRLAQIALFCGASCARGVTQYHGARHRTCANTVASRSEPYPRTRRPWRTHHAAQRRRSRARIGVG